MCQNSAEDSRGVSELEHHLRPLGALQMGQYQCRMGKTESCAKCNGVRAWGSGGLLTVGDICGEPAVGQESGRAFQAEGGFPQGWRKEGNGIPRRHGKAQFASILEHLLTFL